MTQIIITDLEPAVIEKLKVRANRSCRTLEAELKAIVVAVVESEETPQMKGEETLSQARERLTKMRQRYAGRIFRDSTELLREDRQR